jgi:hypothetical protein
MAMAMASAARGEVRIGISGWRCEPWRGVFYPPGLPQRRELASASRMLSTIETSFAAPVKVHAPDDAAHLAARLGLATGLDAQGHFALPTLLPASQAGEIGPTGDPPRPGAH